MLHTLDKYLIDKTNDQKDEYILGIYLSIYISNCVYNTQNYTIFEWQVWFAKPQLEATCNDKMN